MEEIWRDIEGYEGLYQVSNLGRVKSLARNIYLQKWAMPLPEKILKPYSTRKGYLLIDLRKDNKRKATVVHRIVAKTFIPNPENKPQVNHINGIKADNRLENLEWCTNSENQIHAYKTGMQPKSEDRDTGRKKVKCLENKIIFKSLREAGLYMGDKKAGSYIGAACNGVYKTAYGLHWQFVEDEKCQ